MKKKVLALLLAVVMAVSLLPTAAWAEEILFEGTADSDVLLSAPADGEETELPTSGECGENLTWTYAEGVLTISGTGAMDDYEYADGTFTPWYDLNSEIQTVVIEEGVTYIGKSAFDNCFNMTSVNVPVSVTSIGRSAFGWCMNLADIKVAEGNTAYTVVDGVLFSADMKTLHTYPAGKSDTSYAIPDTVTVIYDSAFAGSGNLTEVTIPDGVTAIDRYTFAGCFELAKVNIPGSVTSIGEMAFSSCWALTEMVIPNGVVTIGEDAFYNCRELVSVTIPASVASVGRSAFSQCTELKEVNYGGTMAQWAEVVIEDGNELLLSAGIHCTDGDIEPELVTSGECGENLTWSFADGVLTIEGEGAMYDYDWEENLSPWSKYSEEIETVIVGDGVTTIGKYAFQRHFGLTSATIPGSVTSIGQGAFLFDSELAEVNISEGVTEIGLYAFQGCSSLTDVTIPSTVTTVSNYAFYQTGLTSVVVPATVTNWGAGVFAGCANLTDVTISEGVEVITVQMFAGSGLTEVVIPGSVTVIGDFAFNSTALTSVTIPASVTDIGTNPFISCTSLTAINVAEENPNYVSVDGVLFDKAQTKLMIYPAAKDSESYDIPDSVTEIGMYALYMAALTKVTIPGSLTEVGEYAFGFCADLVEVTISEGVTTIGDYMFYATGLTEVSIPASVTDIGMGAFAACVGLTAIEVAEDNSDYTTVDGVLFNKDQTVILAYPAGKDETSYSIPDSVTAIGAEAFDGCVSLTGVTIPDNVTSIGDWAFQDCASLADVTIPAGVTYIGEGAFYGCSSLTEAVIPDGVAEISAYTFYGCENLTSVTIPASVTFIGNAAFFDCASLTDIYYGGTPEQWGEIYDDGENDLLFGTEPNFTTPEPEIEFSDVPEDAYYLGAIRFAVRNGLFKGNEDGTFNPEGNMNRAEAFVVLGRLAGAADIVNDVEGVSPWYKNAVEWATESGISDGSRPEEDITREELAVMLYQLAGGTDVDASSLDGYLDSDDISDTAVKAMAWAVENGILNGYHDGTLAPQGNAERAHVVTMINRYYEHIMLAGPENDEISDKVDDNI